MGRGLNIGGIQGGIYGALGVPLYIIAWSGIELGVCIGFAASLLERGKLNEISLD